MMLIWNHHVHRLSHLCFGLAVVTPELMKRTHLRRCVVVVLAIGLRGVRHWRASGALRLRGAIQAVVKVAGGEGEHARVLAVYVLVAAATEVVFACAAALTGGPAAELLKLASGLAIGAVAVSAAVVLVRHARGPARLGQMRPLLLATARRVDTSALPAAHALRLACAPRQLLEDPSPLRWAAHYAARHAVTQLAAHPMSRVSRQLVPALDLLDACRTTVDSARFVRHFALTAAELSSPARPARPLLLT